MGDCSFLVNLISWLINQLVLCDDNDTDIVHVILFPISDSHVLVAIGCSKNYFTILSEWVTGFMEHPVCLVFFYFHDY